MNVGFAALTMAAKMNAPIGETSARAASAGVRGISKSPNGDAESPLRLLSLAPARRPSYRSSGGGARTSARSSKTSRSTSTPRRSRDARAVIVAASRLARAPSGGGARPDRVTARARVPLTRAGVVGAVKRVVIIVVAGARVASRVDARRVEVSRVELASSSRVARRSTLQMTRYRPRLRLVRSLDARSNEYSSQNPPRLDHNSFAVVVGALAAAALATAADAPAFVSCPTRAISASIDSISPRFV